MFPWPGRAEASTRAVVVLAAVSAATLVPVGASATSQRRNIVQMSGRGGRQFKTLVALAERAGRAGTLEAKARSRSLRPLMPRSRRFLSRRSLRSRAIATSSAPA